MDVKVLIGARYAVTTDSACSIVDKLTGKPLCTASVGKQGEFVAISDEVVADDESVTVTQIHGQLINVYSTSSSGSSTGGGSGGGEWTDIRPLSNTWTGTNAFNGTVRFASGIDCMGAAYIRADLHKTINSNSLTSTSVLNMGEADGRYALKGEGGGDSGLTPEQVEKLTLYASAEGCDIPAAPQIVTEIGHTYTVSATASPVVVTDANGEPRCTVPAGKQLSFVATTTTTNLSATDCTITENFRAAAPVILSGGGSSEEGGSSAYPWWVGFVEYDEETNEAIAADYSGLELTGDVPKCLKFDNIGFRGDWVGSLGKFTRCNSMFMSNKNLTSFSGDLPLLEVGTSMFNGCSNLVSFRGDLSSLTTGNSMFYQCPNLVTFDSELPSLVDGQGAFNGCNNLASFRGDLSSLTLGHSMFRDCRQITAFNSDLSSLINGDSMFYGCNNLASFSGDLSSLTNGNNMFASCKLDKQSVIYIITCIKERNTCTTNATLSLTINATHQNDDEINQLLGFAASNGGSGTLVGAGGGTWTIKIGYMS